MTGAALRKQALIERARRARAAARAPTVDVAAVCHPKQAALVQAILAGVGRGAVIAADCGRQSGKSHGGALATDLALLAGTGRNWLYVTSTYESCRKMAFRPACDLNRAHGLGGDPVDMEMRMPNGSIGYFMGAESDRTIERLRGTPNLAGCIIDEAGLYGPDKLRQMIEAVKPGLRPLAGVLVVMGTPSRAGKQGTWYDLTVNPVVEQYRFDYRDNDRVPSFAEVERLIDEELAMLFPALTREARRVTAYFLREYLGEFAVDLAERVYQLSDRNLVDAIPPGLEVFATGGDLGLSAEDALVTLGWARGGDDIYVVEERTSNGQDSMAFAAMVRETWERRHPFTIAVDAGGLGGKTIKTVQALFPNIPIGEASKPAIPIQVRALNTLLQDGRLKLLRGSRLAMELSSPTWKNGIVGSEIEEHGRHSDLVPALRYAVLAATPYIARAVPVATDPPPDQETLWRKDWQAQTVGYGYDSNDQGGGYGGPQ